MSSASTRLRSVTSRMAAAIRVRPPSSIGLKLISTGNSLPLRRRPNSVESRAHGAHAHIADVVLAVSDVPGAKSLGHQHLDALADDFVVLVAKQRGDLPIGKADDAGGIDDDHRVRRGIERAAREINGRRWIGTPCCSSCASRPDCMPSRSELRSSPSLMADTPPPPH